MTPDDLAAIERALRRVLGDDMLACVLAELRPLVVAPETRTCATCRDHESLPLFFQDVCVAWGTLLPLRDANTMSCSLWTARTGEEPRS